MAEAKTGVARWNEENGVHARRTSDDNHKRVISLIILAVLTIGCVVCFSPLATTVTRGLYFKGGNEVSVTAVGEDSEAASAEDASKSASIIGRRLGDMQVMEHAVHADGSEVKLAVPEMYDAVEVARAVAGQGLIEFCETDEIGDADAIELINSGASNIEVAPGTYTPFIDSTHISKVDSGVTGTGDAYLSFVFDDEGAKILEDVTGRLAEDRGSVAIIASGRVITVASVPEKLTVGMVSVPISAGKVVADGTKACFNSGLLPVRTTIGEAQHVGALLGEHCSLIALGVAAVAIVAATIACFMRYRKFALIVLGTGLIYSLWVLGLAGIASRVDMYLLTIPAACAGVLLGALALVGAWLAIRHFVNHVSAGGTFKGGALSAGRVGLHPLLWPTAGLLLVGCVFFFLPMPALHEFGQTAVFGVVAALAAVLWFALTTLRIVAAGPAQKDPASWGITITKDAEDESAA